MRKLSSTRVGSVTQVFSYGKWHFPEIGLVLFRKANPSPCISSDKNKKHKMDDVLIQECFDFLNSNIAQLFLQNFVGYLMFIRYQLFPMAIAILFLPPCSLISFLNIFSYIPLLKVCFAFMLQVNPTIFSVLPTHFEKGERCRGRFSTLFVLALTNINWLWNSLLRCKYKSCGI